MKRYLYLFVIATLLLSLISCAVWAQEENGWNFAEDELPGGITATLMPEGNPAAAAVRIENGRMLLAVDSSGVSGSSARRIARIDTEQTYTAAPFLACYFTLEVNDAAFDRSMGFRGADDQAVLTVNGTTLSVFGKPVGTLTAGVEHEICVATGDVTIVSVDSTEVWRGTRLLTEGEKYGVYFNNLGRIGDVNSQMYIDDLYIYTEGNYNPQTNVNDDETLSSLTSFDVNFGMPLICAPSVSIEVGDVEVKAEVDFQRDVISAQLEDGFRQDQSYTVTISDIITVDGRKQEPISLGFIIAPDGYQPPSISLDGLPEIVRPGETVRVYLLIMSDYPEDETLIYLDGQPITVIGGVWEYTFAESGSYQVYGTVRDTMGGIGKTEMYTIQVAVNEPPTIELLELEDSAAPEQMETIRFEITDDTGLDVVHFTVNGQDVTGLAAADGDTYTLSGVPVNLGDMRLEVEAVDLDGETAFFSKNVEVVSGEMQSRIGVQTGFDTGMTTPGIGYLQNLLEADVIQLEDKNNVLWLRQPQGVDQTNYRIYFSTGTTELIGTGMDIYFPGEVSGAVIQGIVKGDGAQEWPAVYRINGASLLLSNGMDTEERQETISSGGWYRLETCVDPVRGIYWMWVNGNMVTPAGGYSFQGLPSKKAAEMRLEFVLGQGQEIYVDNVETRWYSRCPQIMAVKEENNGVVVELDGLFQSSSVQNVATEIMLEKGNHQIEIEQVIYDSEEGRIWLKPAMPLDTANEYRLTLPAGIDYGSNQTVYPMVQYFTTQSGEFDVLDVDFTQHDGRISATAVVQNLSESERTIVMVMTEKSANGAVEGVYSSQMVTVSPGITETVTITNAADSQKGIAVFFLADWKDCIPVKATVYER